MHKKTSLFTLVVICVVAFAVAFAGCTGAPEQTAPATTQPTTTSPADNVLLIATTTSLDNTGLLAELEKVFEEKYNADVQITAKGTGASLQLAEDGNVDVVMVHARSAEDAFIDKGFGIDRRVFAYNYFVVVGPSADPAAIKGMDPVTAFQTIAVAGAESPNSVKFASRGDDSGTHTKEKELWAAAGYDYETDVPIWISEGWYYEVGAGMSDTLLKANELQAYTLTDIGTYLKMKGDGTISSVILVDEGNDLINIYSVMLVNPEKYPDTNTDLGKKWINFMTSDDIQKQIEEFGVSDYGQPLFFKAQGALDILSPSGVTQAEISSPVT